MSPSNLQLSAIIYSVEEVSVVGSNTTITDPTLHWIWDCFYPFPRILILNIFSSNILSLSLSFPLSLSLCSCPLTLEISSWSGPYLYGTLTHTPLNPHLTLYTSNFLLPFRHIQHHHFKPANSSPLLHPDGSTLYARLAGISFFFAVFVAAYIHKTASSRLRPEVFVSIDRRNPPPFNPDLWVSHALRESSLC